MRLNRVVPREAKLPSLWGRKLFLSAVTVGKKEGFNESKITVRVQKLDPSAERKDKNEHICQDESCYIMPGSDSCFGTRLHPAGTRRHER